MIYKAEMSNKRRCAIRAPLKRERFLSGRRPLKHGGILNQFCQEALVEYLEAVTPLPPPRLQQ
jgi:hypothetical protein